MNVTESIRRADDRFRNEFYRAVDDICADPDLKIIRLSGPTCAGKTTASRMLVRRLAEHGKNAVSLSIDDFYYDCEYLDAMSRENGIDGVDYDSPATIDTVAMSEFIGRLFSVGEAVPPRFDFATGRRERGKSISIGDGDVLVLEGIQAVYPQIIELLEGRRSECIFIAPLESIECGEERFEPNEIRLLRRMVRDSNFRSTPVIDTMNIWRSVRENEEKNIFPNASKCKYLVNSTMPYEIGVLRPYLERLLKASGYNGEYSRDFERILSRISAVEPIPSSYIGEDSLYREFV